MTSEGPRTHPRTPTVQTRVLSPLILSVPILSRTFPEETSHFLRLLSEHPATTQESFHSSSSSSLLSESPSLRIFEVRNPPFRRGNGGPQARDKMRLFERSRRRRC